VRLFLSVLQPQFGPLHQALIIWWLMIIEQWWNDNWQRKIEIHGADLPLCYSIQHELHIRLCWEWTRASAVRSRCLAAKIQCDSKLLSVFPRPIFFKPEITKLNCSRWSCSASCSIYSMTNNTFELHFHISSAVLFITSDLKIIGHRNPDNNLESLCKKTQSSIRRNKCYGAIIHFLYCLLMK
jgi:hypothetical protein